MRAGLLQNGSAPDETSANGTPQTIGVIRTDGSALLTAGCDSSVQDAFSNQERHSQGAPQQKLHESRSDFGDDYACAGRGVVGKARTRGLHDRVRRSRQDRRSDPTKSPSRSDGQRRGRHRKSWPNVLSPPNAPYSNWLAVPAARSTIHVMRKSPPHRETINRDPSGDQFEMVGKFEI